MANTQLIVQLFFRAFLRGNHLVIVISRGEVRLEHDIIEQLLAGCEQDIDLRTPGIPPTSALLKKNSFESSSWVEPMDFTPNLHLRLHALYTQ